MSFGNIKNSYKTHIACKEAGCGLRTDGMRCVIIDAEQHPASPSARMCDCIIVANHRPFIIGACELKSGKYDICTVKEQLDGGVKLAKQIRNDHLSSHECKILPILIGKKPKGVHGARLLRTKVTIDGKKRTIIRLNCRASMSGIVDAVVG